MLDRYLIARGGRGGVVFDAEYSADQAYSGAQVLNEDGSDLTVIFPPWHGGGSILDNYAQRLADKGNAVANLRFHDQIIEPNKDRVLASFAAINTSVIELLHQLRSKNDYRRIHLFGASLGNIALGLVASNYSEFDSASMVVPGSDLAACLWEGIRTTPIRDGFGDVGVTKQELIAAWSPLAPKTNAKHFAGKEVKIVSSSTDEVIPATYQAEFVEAMCRHGAVLSHTKTWLGHYATIVRHCLRTAT